MLDNEMLSEKISETLKGLGVPLVENVAINKQGCGPNGEAIISGCFRAGSPPNEGIKYFASTVWSDDMQNLAFFDRWCKAVAIELARRKHQYISKKKGV